MCGVSIPKSSILWWFMFYFTVDCNQCNFEGEQSNCIVIINIYSIAWQKDRDTPHNKVIVVCNQSTVTKTVNKSIFYYVCDHMK